MKLIASFFSIAIVALAEAPINFTATTENVSGAPDSIRINVTRWSTDAERDQLLAAWNLTASPPTAARGPARGAAAAAAPDPAAADGGDAAPAPAAGRGAAAGGRGGRGGGGRGGGRGGAAPAAAQTPESSLTAALEKATTVGYIWSSEVAGYALRYAVKLSQPDGGERIILVTDRRLGAWNDLWKPAGADAATNYEFSVVEVHLNAKGEGEGKISLTGKVTVDAAGKTFALDNFAALPVVLKNVRRAK